MLSREAPGFRRRPEQPRPRCGRRGGRPGGSPGRLWGPWARRGRTAPETGRGPAEAARGFPCGPGRAVVAGGGLLRPTGAPCRVVVGGPLRRCPQGGGCRRSRAGCRLMPGRGRGGAAVAGLLRSDVRRRAAGAAVPAGPAACSARPGSPTAARKLRAVLRPPAGQSAPPRRPPPRGGARRTAAHRPRARSGALSGRRAARGGTGRRSGVGVGVLVVPPGVARLTARVLLGRTAAEAREAAPDPAT